MVEGLEKFRAHFAEFTDHYVLIGGTASSLDLSKRKAKGESIDSKDVKKHKNDIFRLFTVLDRDVPCQLPDSIKQSMEGALMQLSKETVDFKSLRIRSITLKEVLTSLAEFYELNVTFE